MTTGEQLKMEGIEANLAAATSVLRDYKHYAEVALAELALSGVEFTVDDIRRKIPDGLEPHHPNVLPSLLGQWASQNRIYPVDWHTSRRPTRHSSRNRVWVGNKYRSEAA